MQFVCEFAFEKLEIQSALHSVCSKWIHEITYSLFLFFWHQVYHLPAKKSIQFGRMICSMFMGYIFSTNRMKIKEIEAYWHFWFSRVPEHYPDPGNPGQDSDYDSEEKEAASRYFC